MQNWPTFFLPALALVTAVWTAGLSTQARADGAFFQADLAPRASSVTATGRRGPLTVSLGWSEFDTGNATTAWGSYGLNLGPGAWLRVGPSLRIDNAGARDLGLKAGLERFSIGERTTLFLLAEATTIETEYLALAQLGHIRSGLAAEVAFQGNTAGFRERSLAVSYRLRDGPVRLRIGYRLNARRLFLGVSINTF